MSQEGSECSTFSTQYAHSVDWLARISLWSRDAENTPCGRIVPRANNPMGAGRRIASSILRWGVRSPGTLLGLAIIVAVSVGIVVHWDLLGFAERSYINKNQMILASLPVLPEAARISERSNAYFGDSQLSAAQGYRTAVTYRFPPGVTWDDILAFYAGQFSAEWEVEIREAGQAGPSPPAAPEGPEAPTLAAVTPIPYLRAVQGHALVSVQLRTDGPAGSEPPGGRATEYVVVVDHGGR
jgi:hypothetical protein